MAKVRLTHPGRILREEFLEPMGLSPYAVAKSLKVPPPRVNDIVREQRAISSEMAVLLAAYFGTTEQFWSNLQSHYDLATVKPAVVRRAAQIRRRQDENRDAGVAA